MLVVSYEEIRRALRAPYNRRRISKEIPQAILKRVLDERVKEPGVTKGSNSGLNGSNSACHYPKRDHRFPQISLFF